MRPINTSAQTTRPAVRFVYRIPPHRRVGARSYKTHGSNPSLGPRFASNLGMVDPVSSSPTPYHPFGPRRVEPTAHPEPTRDATDRCVCPADLLESLPGSLPFDTHLRMENARADLIRRAADRADAPNRSKFRPPSTPESPKLGDVSPVERSQVHRRLAITYNIQRTHRPGVVIDLVG